MRLTRRQRLAHYFVLTSILTECERLRDGNSCLSEGNGVVKKTNRALVELPLNGDTVFSTPLH